MSKARTPATLAAGAALALAACGPDALVMSRTTGVTGTGGFSGATLRNSGEMVLELPQETFTGRWVAVREGANQSLELLSAYGSGSILRSTANLLSETEAGFGTAILTSDKGRSMRCEFRYSGVNITAIGVCQTTNGEIFDLQVS
ncbi:hypothetical protein [Roseicyclus persicicus]|uniref:Uncharacterized protein n=1 Tax=Roseicyclus persicicus TaxID=2650661 RepID=A0A7X6K0U2_9RHOB|nr:hypothetical protein [Roseibacterium persicicum]NKX46228.1 hypothetical protein [Roseibacterium persicicum]